MPQKSSGFGLASGVDVTRQLPEEEAREMRTALLQEVAYPIRSAGFDAEQLNLEFPNTVGPFATRRSIVEGRPRAGWRSW